MLCAFEPNRSILFSCDSASRRMDRNCRNANKTEFNASILCCLQRGIVYCRHGRRLLSAERVNRCKAPHQSLSSAQHLPNKAPVITCLYMYDIALRRRLAVRRHRRGAPMKPIVVRFQNPPIVFCDFFFSDSQTKKQKTES